MGLQLANTDLLTGGRRLLGLQEGEDADEMHDSLAVRISRLPGWNHTRSICRPLVLAHMRDVTALGVLDLQALQRCVHWREVARDAIAVHNLTALDGHDTLLLGWDDLLQALNSKGVLDALLVRPLFWATVVSQSPLFTPLLQLSEVVGRRLHAWHVHASGSRDPWLQAISGAVSKALGGLQTTDPGPEPDPARAAHAASQLLALQQVRALSWGSVVARPRSTNASGQGEPMQGPAPLTSLRLLASPSEAAPHPEGHARALLSLPEDVATYSGLTSSFQGASDVPLSNRISELWTQGPLSWPPRFDRHLYSSCTAGEDVLDLLVDTALVLDMHYKRQTPVRRVPIRFSGVAPVSFTRRFGGNRSSTAGGRPPGGRGDMASQAMDFLTLDVMGGLFGLYPADVRGLFSGPAGVRSLLSTALTCDFEAVTLCTHRTHNLAVSLVLSLLIYLAVGAVAGSIGMPGLGTVALLAVPSLVMYLSYGLSPLCIPQVPTCFLDDLVDALTTVIPGQVSWPDALQVYPQCLGPTAWQQQQRAGGNSSAAAGVRAGTADCLRDCRAGPFLFDGWESNAAWLACGVAPSTCPLLDIPYFPRFQARASLYSATLRAGPQDLVDAHTVCNGLTFVLVLPYLFLSLLAAYLLASAALVPLQVVPQAVSVVVNVVGYNHAGDA